MANVRRHPLDFDALKKGDTISLAELEDILSIRSDDPSFPLKRLALQQQIESEMDERGNPVTVATRKGQIVILTDDQAAEYNPHCFRLYQRRMAKAHARTLAVDPGELTDIQRRQHEQNVMVQTRVLAAGQEARQLALRAVRRSVPKLEK